MKKTKPMLFASDVLFIAGLIVFTVGSFTIKESETIDLILIISVAITLIVAGNYILNRWGEK